jgi:hypothetical protein
MAREKKNSAEDAVDAAAARQAQIVQENEDREAESRPTPTQRENDLARVGARRVTNRRSTSGDEDEDGRRSASTSQPAGNFTNRTVNTGGTPSGGAKPAGSGG